MGHLIQSQGALMVVGLRAIVSFNGHQARRRFNVGWHQANATRYHDLKSTKRERHVGVKVEGLWMHMN